MSFQILSGQLLVGLINGSFYALLSLGFAVIFGLLGIINVAQGTFYMLGAFGSWMLLNYAGVGYWPALILSPAIAAVVGVALEVLLKPLGQLRAAERGDALDLGQVGDRQDAWHDRHADAELRAALAEAEEIGVVVVKLRDHHVGAGIDLAL